MKTFKRHLQAFWGGTLERFLPLHAKRLVFLATLYTYMTGGEGNEEQDLKDLNDALTLATTSTEAIIIPSMLTHWIWKGNGKNSAAWSEEQLTKKFVTRCPCWLNYGRPDDLMSDIKAVQNFIASRA